MAPVVFAQPNPTPQATVVLTHEVWARRPAANSRRPTRQLVGAIGQSVTEEQAKKWGVGKKKAAKGFYFVPPTEPIEALTGDELVKRAQNAGVENAKSLGAQQLRDAIEAAEAKEDDDGDGAADAAGTQADSGTAPRRRPTRTTAKPGPDQTQAQPAPGE